DYYQTANNIYWLISAVLSPVNTTMRYMASQAGVSRPWAMLQQNLVLWFYTAFLQRLGVYLIDLNSGRLRVGADRYRQLLAERGQEAGGRGPESGRRGQESEVRSQGSEIADNAALATAPAVVAIGLIGQVKAGKSSLINALLGEQRARTNVL